MIKTIRLLVFLAILLNSGCDKSAEAPVNIDYPAAAALLGLGHDHTLHYRIFDSTAMYDPDTVSFDTIDLYLTITRGLDTQVELAVNDTAHGVLTVDELGILHTGQIRPYGNPPDTLFFYPTPVIFPETFRAGSVWTLNSPPYSDSSGEQRQSMLYLNYGYLTERKFKGQIDVILPTGSYEAYHCHSILYLNETNPDTQKIIDEYFAPGVGLVKLVSAAPGHRRLIILLEDQ